MISRSSRFGEILGIDEMFRLHPDLLKNIRWFDLKCDLTTIGLNKLYNKITPPANDRCRILLMTNIKIAGWAIVQPTPPEGANTDWLFVDNDTP